MLICAQNEKKALFRSRRWPRCYSGAACEHTPTADGKDESTDGYTTRSSRRGRTPCRAGAASEILSPFRMTTPLLKVTVVEHRPEKW